MKNPKIPDSLIILIKRNLENQFDIQSLLTKEQQKRIYHTYRQILLDRWESFGYLTQLDSKYYDGISKIIADELKSEFESIEAHFEQAYTYPSYESKIQIIFPSICFKGIRFYRKLMQIANKLEIKETSGSIVRETLGLFL